MDLVEKVEMGLTWIDHDTIEQPVEDVEVKEHVKTTFFEPQTSLFNLPPYI